MAGEKSEAHREKEMAGERRGAGGFGKRRQREKRGDGVRVFGGREETVLPRGCRRFLQSGGGRKASVRYVF